MLRKIERVWLDPDWVSHTGWIADVGTLRNDLRILGTVLETDGKQNVFVTGIVIGVERYRGGLLLHL